MDPIEQIISDTTADLGDSSPVDTSTESETVDTSTGNDDAVDKTAQPDPLADEPDAFAKEHGYRSKRPDGRENRLPHSRVQKISENAVRKNLTAIAKELGITKAEAELKLDDIMASLGERKTKFGEYESRVNNMKAIEDIMEKDADRFMSMLAEANPAYKKFTEKQQAAVDKIDTSAQRQAEAPANDPKPEPDYPLGEGKFTYSMEGLEKLRAWDKRQTLREANEGFKKTLDERFKPIDDQNKADQARRQAEAVRGKALEAIDKKLARASKWHGWKDNEQAILDAIKADPELGLEDAYMQVVIPKLAGDRTKMREDILAEIKKTPGSTSTTTKQPAGKTEEPQSMEDIIRASIKGLAR